jgi:putative nucleotidyltransferase with HDIG domain
VNSNSHESDLQKLSDFVSGIIEGRDPDLYGHHQRTGKFAMLFAQHIGCSEEDSELLAIGARIHDIGKLSINEHILNKPTQLTATEFSLIRQHTEIGDRLLAPLKLDARIAEIVRYHHENYDGSGYPQGLAGDEIPFLPRVIRVLDSLDALTSNRPYHPRVSCDEALRIMKRESHVYDPFLLESCCEMMNKHPIEV